MSAIPQGEVDEDAANGETSNGVSDLNSTIRRQTLRSSASIIIFILIIAASLASLNPASTILDSILGFVCSVSALGCVPPTYFICRAFYWHFFRRKRKELSLPKIELFSDAKKPTEFPGVQAIDDFQQKVVWKIPLYQGRARAVLFTVASLPALTILSLALRGLIGLNNGFSIGLLFGESFYLGLLLWFILSDKGPTTKWLSSRTQAELLRREQYICFGRLGVYKDSDKIEKTIVNRLALLDTDDFNELKSLIPMYDFRVLHDSQSHAVVKDIQGHLESYIKFRIQKQLFHMQWALHDAQQANLILTRILASAGILALLSAFGHSIIDPIPTAKSAGIPTIELTNAFLVVSAIATSFAAFAVATSNLLKLEQLSRLYSWVILELRKKQEDALLLAKDVSDSPECMASLQGLIYDVEGILTNELLQFLLVSEKNHSLG